MIFNAIIPGAGHIYWRETLFGMFVFLVMLIAAVLFFFSFLIDLSFMVRLVLFGLPAVFFLFSMVDLGRSAPLTLAEPGSILIATFGQGTVTEIHQVPAQNIIGKLHRLF